MGRSKVRTEEDLYVNTDYEILYEDDFLIVVNKPSPLPVHPVGRFKEKNLLSLLKRDFYKDVPLRMVHRLDSETSGIVLAAKTQEAASRLAGQFEARTIAKEYIGLVFGILGIKKGKISLPLGRVIENNYHLRTVDPAGESAETFFEVMGETEDPSSRNSYSWVRMNPLTGRTHQLRAHFSFLGHPIVGDKIYIDNGIYDRYVRSGWQEDMLEILKLPRLALHASGIRIRHPGDAREMEFHADLPEILTRFITDSQPRSIIFGRIPPSNRKVSR